LRRSIHSFPTRRSSDLFKLALAGELPENWAENLPVYDEDENGPASRETSGDVLNAIAEVVPNFWGGSADLSGSNKTLINAAGDRSEEHTSELQSRFDLV